MNYGKTTKTTLMERAKDALEFAKKYPGWNTFEKDDATIRPINMLRMLGLVEVNNHSQFRYIEDAEQNEKLLTIPGSVPPIK